MSAAAEKLRKQRALVVRAEPATNADRCTTLDPDAVPSGGELPHPDQSGRVAAIAELKRQIEQLRIQHHPAHPLVPTGLPLLDAALGGGFSAGAIHEFLAPTAGGAAFSLALRAARSAAERRPVILLIDSDGDFYPPAAAQLGIDLDRLMIARPRRTIDRLWVFDQALRCPAIAAVILPLKQIDPATSRRLQLAAEAGGALGIVINHSNAGATFAATRLRLTDQGRDSSDQRQHSMPRRAPSDQSRDRGKGAVFKHLNLAAPGHMIATPRLVQVTVLKTRQGCPPPSFVLELDDYARAVPVPAGPANTGRATHPRSATA